MLQKITAGLDPRQVGTKPMAKKRQLSAEALRQRRMAFYHGVSRDSLRNAARRCKASRPATKPEGKK